MKTYKQSILAMATLVGCALGATAQEGPITTVPSDAIVNTYLRSEVDIKRPWNDPYFEVFQKNGFVCEIAFAGNEVYLKDPVSRYAMGTYVKGIMSADNKSFTVTLPQLVYNDSFYGPVYLDKMVYSQYPYYNVVPENENAMKFEIREDGTVEMDFSSLQDTHYPKYVWGLTYYDENNEQKWMGYAAGNAVFTIKDSLKPLTELPIGAEEEDWVLQYGEEDRMVKVARLDNNIYIGNLYQGFENVYIKGTVNGNLATFPSGQYLGIYAPYNSAVWFVAAYQERYEWEGQQYTRLAMKDNLLLVFSDEGKTLGTETDYITINPSKDKLDNPYVLIGAPTFRYQNTVDGFGAPQDPVWKYCSDYGTDFDLGIWSFDLPKYDVNNLLLPLDRYYYNIYTDDVLFEMFEDEYPGVSGVMTDIPYNFANGQNVEVRELLHTIYYYFGGFDEFSIQSFYLDENKQKHYSNRVYNTVNSVEDLGADPASLNAEWYDMQGRKVQNPEKGLYIKSVTMPNGTRKAVKVNRK